MRYTFIGLCLFAMLASNCKPKATKYTPGWDRLTITSEDDEVITINNTDDTSIIKYYDGGSLFTGRHKAKVDSLHSYFTMAEKDTLFSLADDLIAKPVKYRRGCTDFVGDLKLVVDYGGYRTPGSCRQSIEYSGVCEWDTLSAETRHLHAILKRHIKWWQK